MYFITNDNCINPVLEQGKLPLSVYPAILSSYYCWKCIVSDELEIVKEATCAKHNMTRKRCFLYLVLCFIGLVFGDDVHKIGGENIGFR